MIPTAGGGFSAQHQVIQIKLTFKEGGAFDFQSTLERIKEQVTHAAEIARENGRPVNASNGPIDVNLEQLPAYEEVGSTGSRPPQPAAPSTQESLSQVQRPIPIAPNGAVRPSPLPRAATPPPTAAAPYPHPNEPPPGYEEVQSSSIANDLEQRLRDESARL